MPPGTRKCPLVVYSFRVWLWDFQGSPVPTWAAPMPNQGRGWVLQEGSPSGEPSHHTTYTDLGHAFQTSWPLCLFYGVSWAQP